jgi:PqqD family protein of HPr-rel-A system
MPSPDWILTRPQHLLWRDWGDHGAVYDAASGDTHLLSALAIELLSLLRAAPRSEAELVSDLAPDMPDAGHDGVQTLIREQLLGLQALGLVQRAAAYA